MDGRGNIRTIIIVGGGTAGWMVAATLARYLGENHNIRLVESNEIGIVGVGEASIPSIRQFNDNLGIKEADFLQKVQGTFKLGIKFDGWKAPREHYYHSFGGIGTSKGIIPFYQYWLRHIAEGGTDDLWNFSEGKLAAEQYKFGKTNSLLGEAANILRYAYHFDSYLYGQFLRRIAEINDVIRIEGKIVDVRLHSETGFIEGVQLENGTVVDGDFFIDCSGFRALLIGDALGSEYEDWSHYLPCNRALAVPSKSVEPLTPYTQSTARNAGWQWRIPLQNRTGNGYVYCSDFVSDDEATQTLMDGLDGEPLGEPRLIKFVTGKRKQLWKKNCVGIGLAGGFMEPLESTSIQLVQTAVMRLLNLFPSKGFHQPDIDKFNTESDNELTGIRQFLILHYHVNQRTGLPFWDRCRDMPIPDSLSEKIALFKTNGRIMLDAVELFGESSWLQVMIGQGLSPQGYHPLVDQRTKTALKSYIDMERQHAAQSVEKLPLHSDYLRSVIESQNMSR